MSRHRREVALRHALDDLASLGGGDLVSAEKSGSGPPRAGVPDAELPSRVRRPDGTVAVPRRGMLHWQPVARPTVADIQARLAAATAEVDHSEPALPLSTVAA